MHEENQQNSKYLWKKIRTYVSDDKLPKRAYTVNQLQVINQLLSIPRSYYKNKCEILNELIRRCKDYQFCLDAAFEILFELMRICQLQNIKFPSTEAGNIC